MPARTSSYSPCDQFPPLSRKQLGLEVDSIILAQRRGVKQLAKMTTDSIDGDVPVSQYKLTREQAKNARMLQLLRTVLTKPAVFPKPSEDDDFSEPDLEKVDSVVIIQLRTPVSRAKSAPPTQSALAPPPAGAAAAATVDEQAVAGSAAVSLTTASPLATATSSIAEDAEPSTSSSSAQVAEELINAPATSTTTSSSSTKKVSKGKKLLKSASKKIKAAASSIARDFREGYHETTYAIASSSAMLALWPVPLPASAYTGLYCSYYNPYDGPRSSYALGYHH